jgi:iron complex outermembrane receptor protein
VRQLGAFGQYTWKPNRQYTLETGLRGEWVQGYGAVVLPRLAALYQLTEDFSARINMGLGYKTPTLFTEQSEVLAYRGVVLPAAEDLLLERSFGVNFDFNYQTELQEDLTLSWNQLFFYTQLNHPLILQSSAAGSPYVFGNLEGQYATRGLETNLKFSYAEAWKLFLGYTFTDAREKASGSTPLPLTPKHRLNSVLMYEVEEKWRLGLEAYYFSPQVLSDAENSPSYWVCGLMGEKMWERWSVFLNFENFLDTRQTRFGELYTGYITRPQFREIYAPVDGFVVNAGVKILLKERYTPLGH